LLADIRRLSVVAVMFLYQITVFYNKIQQHHFWNFILMTQCKLCTRAAAAVDKERSQMGPMKYLRLLFHNGTSKIGTLTDADRRINVFFMTISYSQGARN